MHLVRTGISFVFILGLLAASPDTAPSSRGETVQDRLQEALAGTGRADAALAALAKGDYAVADEYLSRLNPAGTSARAEVISLRGAIAFLSGHFEQSASLFDEAARICPLQDPDNFTLAMALISLRNDERARQILAGLSARHPSDALYIYWLGRINYDQRRYSEANEQFTKALQLQPNSARIWDSMGLTYDMQGKQNEALGAFEKAVAINRKQARPSPWPPTDFGSLLLRTGNWPAAEDSLREALRYQPELSQAHYYLGRVLEKEAKDAEAIQQYQTAMSADVSSTDACYSLAQLYRKLHRDSDASAMFSEWKKRRAAADLAGSTLVQKQ